MAKEKKDKSKIPPIIINHNESGHIIMGAEGKDSKRPRDIGLYASKSDNHLRLFRDGGFELQSSATADPKDGKRNQKDGSQIIQSCTDAPLTITSEGDINIVCKRTFSVKAERIQLTSYADDGVGVNVNAESDIRISAGRDYIVTAENVTHDAKERILSHSEGWTILIGQCIRLHEPITKICPAFMREYIEGQIKNLKG